jgi:thiosulfate dehydrogenase [quinone] large subunit
MKNWTDHQLAFVIARITIGINFLLHGVVRLPKMEGFASGLSKGFEGTMLPPALVEPIAFGLPIVEIVLGVLLIIGFKTRLAAALSFILITLLMAGTSFKEDWDLVGSQMIYVIFFFIFIKNLRHNTFAIDGTPKTVVDGFTSSQ